MMKKKNLCVLVLILMILFLIVNVDAATDECPASDMSVYRLEANNVSVTYELNKDIEMIEGVDVYSYDIIVSNLTKNLVFRAKGYDFTYDDSENGELVFENFYYKGTTKATFYVYTAPTTNCKSTLLKTININLPYWNRFSERKECNGYEELPVCMATTDNSNVTDKNFLDIFNKQKKEYEEKLANEKKKNNIFTWYWKNRKVTIPVTVAIIMIPLVVLGVKFFIENRKVKVKLGSDFDEKDEL